MANNTRLLKRIFADNENLRQRIADLERQLEGCVPWDFIKQVISIAGLCNGCVRTDICAAENCPTVQENIMKERTDG